MLDIAELADRAPYQLSGGEKKRVAIASVLVMNPEVLLFDEPTAALDPRTQQWLIELIVELNDAGKTIVLATHDLETIDVLADRCLVFGEDHRIVADGLHRATSWPTATCCSRQPHPRAQPSSTAPTFTATCTGSITTCPCPTQRSRRRDWHRRHTPMIAKCWVDPKPVLGGELIGKRCKGLVGNLDHLATAFAQQMLVTLVGQVIRRRAVPEVHVLDDAELFERDEVAVDGRFGDLRVSQPDLTDDVFGAQASSAVVEQNPDRCPTSIGGPAAAVSSQSSDDLFHRINCDHVANHCTTHGRRRSPSIAASVISLISLSGALSGEPTRLTARARRDRSRNGRGPQTQEPIMNLAGATIRLLAAAAAAALPVTAVATTAHASIPTPGTTILLVHGFNASAPFGGHIDCKDSTMKPWADGLRARGFTVKTVAWYADDTNCDMAVPGISDNTVNTSLDQVAREFTNLVANRFGSTPVGISAHSMGGLVVRRAIDGVEHHHSGFSANIRVSDVVTSGTPHRGTGITSFCTNVAVAFTECSQAAPGSAFLGALANNPQTTGGTDWTLTGSECDLVVSAASATGMATGDGPVFLGALFAAPPLWLGGCTFVAPFGPRRPRQVDAGTRCDCQRSAHQHLISRSVGRDSHRVPAVGRFGAPSHVCPGVWSGRDEVVSLPLVAVFEVLGSPPGESSVASSREGRVPR